MTIAYIGIGTNLGDRLANLHRAIALLNRAHGVRIKKVSSFYETEPVGYKNQDWFLNGVLEIETSLKPVELLRALQTVEETLYRRRTIKWGPRTIDLDLLLYDGQQVSEPGLEVPHPRMLERRFVLVPLAEIAPMLRLPNGQTVQMALAALPAGEAVNLYTGPGAPETLDSINTRD